MHDTSALPLIAAATHERLHGLVWAYRMGKARAEVLPDDGIASALLGREGWVWLHIDLVDQRSHGWVCDLCGLPPSARVILEGHDESLTLGHEDGIVHGICADFHRDLEAHAVVVGRFCFAVTEHLLVTGRRHPLAACEDVRQSLERGARPATAFDLFGALVLAFCRTASGRLTTTTTLLDEVEDRIVTERVSNERKRLMAVRRLAVSMHRPVAGLAALFQDDDRSAWVMPPAGHAVLRRLADRLVALDRELVMVNDRAKLLQEEIATELADESNRSLKALAVMSALLLPGSLVVGIFGMNTDGLPLTATPGGFWIAIGLLVLATLTFYLTLRKAGADLRF